MQDQSTAKPVRTQDNKIEPTRKETGFKFATVTPRRHCDWNLFKFVSVICPSNSHNQTSLRNTIPFPTHRKLLLGSVKAVTICGLEHWNACPTNSVVAEPKGPRLNTSRYWTRP